MTDYLKTSAAAIALLIGSAAQAQTQTSAAGADTSLTIGEITVTAERQPRIARVLTSVDVLGGSIAQRENVDGLFQLFARMPGVLTTNFGQGPSNDGNIAFRGFNGEGGINAVKLLIDGVPSNTNDGFTWMLDAVQPMDIDRIEVVRGTSDPRYGLHNIAGNVSIFTRRGGTFLDGKATAGSFNTYEGQAAAGYEDGGISQNYFVGYRRSGGFRDHADSRRLTASGKWFYGTGPISVGAIARYYHGKGEEPGYLNAADARDRPQTSYPVSQTDGGTRTIQQYSLHLEGDLAPALTTATRLYAIDYDDVRFVRFSESISQQERNNKQRQYGGLTSLSWSPDMGGMLHALAIQAGGDFQIQHNRAERHRTTRRVRTGQAFAQDFDLSVYGAYVQAVIEPTDWLKITPAYRIDRTEGHFDDLLSGARYGISRYGTIGQPKISAAITPVEELTLYGNYGRTFQIGLGSSSYLIPPQTVSTNPSYNDGWEIGAKLRRGSWFEGRVAVWKQVAKGEVQYDELRAIYNNLGRTRRTGFDVQANFNPSSQISLWAALSRQRGVITVPNPATPEQRGNTIDHVPKYLLSGGIDYKPDERLRLTLLGNAQSNYELDTTNLNGRYGGFGILHAEVAYRLTPRVELSGQVRNLTNDRYAYVWWDGEQTLHAPADRRAYYANLRLTL